MYDLKTAFGKASIGQNLLDSIGQCNRVLINMTTGYKTRSLAFAIKKYFEVNSKAVEVLIFKGRKRISIDRFIATNDDFFSAQRIYPVGKAWLIKNKVVPLQHGSY